MRQGAATESKGGHICGVCRQKQGDRLEVTGPTPRAHSPHALPPSRPHEQGAYTAGCAVEEKRRDGRETAGEREEVARPGGVTAQALSILCRSQAAKHTHLVKHTGQV